MKKIIRKSMAWILSVAMIFSVFVSSAIILAGTSLKTSAATFSYDYFEFEENDDGSATLTGHIGISGNKVIPDMVYGHKVTSIGDGAFYECNKITSVTIPDSVIRIGNDAFRYCKNLKTVDIPDSVESIGSWAFHDTAWYDSQPDGLVYAGKVAYSYKGEVPENTSISIALKNGTKGIASSAFADTGIAHITIPDSVTNIGKNAFLNTVWYDSQPLGVVYAGKFAYDYKYKGGMPENTIITFRSNTKGIVESAFCGCDNLKSITIPDSVESIGDYAFYGTSLTSVTIPDSVESIGKEAFSHCYSLTSVTISDSVTIIGEETFLWCDKLKSVTIPDSVTIIGKFAFSGCSSLTSVTIPDSVTIIGKGAFSDCSSLTSVTIPDSVESIGEYAFSSCKSLKSVAIPDSVESIGEYAFRNCSSLTSVTIPDSVTSIGEFAFRDCSSLTSVTIPDSVEFIGMYAFKGCDNLTIYGIKGSYAETYANRYNIPFNSELNNRSVISDKAVTLGKTVTIKCAAIGGTGGYTYAVYYKKKTDSKWATAQNYSSNSVVKFRPAKAVDYDVCVKVKDSSGELKKKYYIVSVSDKLKNTSTVSSESITLGNKVTVNAAASGGKTPYKYAVYYKKQSDSKWAVSQDFSTNSTLKIKPAKAVKYDVCVKVKDSNKTIEKKYFVITVN